MLKQRTWRVVGAGSVVFCGVMAWYGVDSPSVKSSLLVLLAYWGAFLVLLACGLLCVLIDIRYVRLQYAIGKRELLRQTLQDEELRKALCIGQQRASELAANKNIRRKPVR